MNQQQEIIKDLLFKWHKNLSIGRIKIDDNIKLLKQGEEHKFKQEAGKTVCFDFRLHNEQKCIQKQLTELFPEHAKLINSTPEELDGVWLARDYIDLYLSHYELLLEKLCKLVG